MNLFRRRKDPLRQLARLESARSAMAAWTSTTVEKPIPQEPTRRRLLRSHKTS